MLDARPGVIDLVEYANVPADLSEGLFPDGQANSRQAFYFSTPGRSNDPSPGPFTLFINEWMASNTGYLADPADGKFDDWFELYNPSSIAVDLGGFSLTDNPTNTIRWPIPTGTTIGPHGYLLVWADNDTNQNGTGLHADFKLDKEGDSIALFAPDGRLVDAVAFEEQLDDTSQGRWPDGNPAPFFLMPTPTPRWPNLVPMNPPAEIQIVQTTISEGRYFALSWSAEPGCIYRVQYRADVDARNWTDLSGDVFAQRNLASKADPAVVAGDARFYRVILVR